MHTHTLLSVAHGRLLRVAVLNRNFVLNWYLPVLLDGDGDGDADALNVNVTRH